MLPDSNGVDVLPWESAPVSNIAPPGSATALPTSARTLQNDGDVPQTSVAENVMIRIACWLDGTLMETDIPGTSTNVEDVVDTADVSVAVLVPVTDPPLRLTFAASTTDPPI